MKPYYIWTPRYERNSAGIRVLYKLVELLRQKGMTVRTSIYNSNSASVQALYKLRNLLVQKGIKYNSNGTSIRALRKLRNVLIQKDITATQNRPSRDAIAIYPEIVPGNPFNCQQPDNPFNCQLVVRWILQVPGMFGNQTAYAPSDFIFAYYKAFMPNGMKCDGELFVSSIEPELFNNEGVEERKGGVYFVHKGWRTPRIAETLNLPEIKGDFPPNRAELAKLLKRSEYVYTYDNSTSLSDEARLCGCPVIRIPDPYNDYHLERWGEMATLGIVEDIKDIDKARSELSAFQKFYWEKVRQTDRQLDEFIRITQSSMPLPSAAIPNETIQSL